jgi:hypothetical protein
MSEESTVKQSLQKVQDPISISTLEVEMMLDYITFVESSLEDMLDDCEVFFVFPPIEDLRSRGVEIEHTIKLMVDDVLLISCCGTDPEVIIHRLFRWAESMFDSAYAVNA